MATTFVMKHLIDAPESVFWNKIFGNEEFNERLYKEELGFGYEFMGEENGKRRSKVVPSTSAPAVVKKALGDGSFFEVGSLVEKQRYRFEIEPSTLRDKMDIRGEMWTEKEGEDKCFRIVELTVSAKVFGVGKVIESFIESTTRSNYDVSARFTNRYFKETSD